MKKVISGFSAQSRGIWNEIHREWKLSRLEEAYLRQGLESLDMALDCEARAKEEGLTLADANQRKYLNPLLLQSKNSRNNYLRLMKLIGFEKTLREKVKRRVGHPTDSEVYANGRDD